MVFVTQDHELKWSPEELKTENAILRGNLDALLAVLQRIEWISDRYGEMFCPCCTWPQSEGHHRTCELAQALARARGAPPSERME